MNKRLLGLVAVVVFVLGLVAAGLFVMRSLKDDHPADEPTPVARTMAGAPPSPADAPYLVDFGRREAPSWRDLQMRVLTLGALEAPPFIGGGAVSQGASLTERVATYFERRSPGPVRRIGLQAVFPRPTSSPRWR
ncbi:hypothetical protein M4D79_06940 [Mycolicibacterium novocastrense]|nr:hypothetical protein M4D79_06940 [Mycolicibacterium novocastrense]